ncbi:MAG: TonB-dependent receptor [Gemmatimonadetes bacterium]|nr:TonB-dependent receptor [Gemmatimonadota bacterium]
MSNTFLSSMRRATVLLLAVALPAASQSGRITGRVTDAANQPLVSAQVLVVGTALGAETNADGKFTVTGVAAGTYAVRAQHIGHKVALKSGVTVAAGQAATVEFQLDATPVTLGGVVISASRRVEKITDAPATVSRLDALALANSIGNGFAPALKEVKGLDFLQVGITAVAVNARGFNSSFNNRMLQMEDGRIGVLPENGLPVGGFSPIPKVDLGAVEVLVGPGSALYGPDASNGVITLQAKDAKQHQGFSGEFSTGSRSFVDLQARYARATRSGKWAYKISGEIQSAEDYHSSPVYPAVGTSGPLTEKGTDYRTDVKRGYGAVTYHFAQGGRLEVAGGASVSNGIGQTNVGRNQLVDWGYRVGQVKFTSPRWFAQAYQSQSLSGGTYQLNGYTQNRVRYPTISDDSVKRLSDFPAKGILNAAEVQNNFSIGMLGKTGASAIDNTHVIWGIQYRNDNVTSKRQWLSDRLTGENITASQLGGYLQFEAPLPGDVRLVGAGRYDKHENYDPQFSPKAALLWTPVQDQTVRVTYNRAFKSPTLLQTNFYFPNFSPFVGIFGNKDGFQVKNAAGAVVAAYDPIQPETNTTYELGYKGVVKDRLYIDIAAYKATYDNFLSPLIIIANPLLGAAATNAYNAATGKMVGSEVNAGPQVALTYVNVGKAKISGVDAGARLYITPQLTLSSNISILKVDTIETPSSGSLVTAATEATAFNSPTLKWTVGLDDAQLVGHVSGGLMLRTVNEYFFRSGVNVGRLPGFTTLDLNVGADLPWQGTRLMVRVQNLYTCTTGTTTPPAAGVSGTRTATFGKERACGFGRQHQEMLNMPLIGPMVFAGVRYGK